MGFITFSKTGPAFEGAMPTRKQFLGAMAAAAIRAKSSFGAPQIFAALAGGKGSWELSGDFFKLVVTSDERGIWISRFLLADQTDNLACEDVGSGMGRSCTGLRPVDGRWWFSALPPSGTVVAEGGRIQVSGILLGPPSEPIAREDWSLSVGDDSLLWQVERAYLRDVRLVADRFPALVLRPRTGGRFFGAPGFLDLGMRLDGPSMFPLHSLDVERYEAISPRLVQTLRFAPSGIALDSVLTTGFFSFAKPNRDSTAPDLALGAETVDRTKGPELRAAGAHQAQAWMLRKSRAPGLPFELVLPDGFLTEQSRSFAAVHNQWMGWLFGNNPASTPVLQEMGWFPMIQGIFPRNPETLAALGKELRFFADQGVDPQGFVYPRWAAAGFYRARWGEMVDQIPMFILAMYYHVLNSGDRDFAQRMMPTLDRVYRYIMAFDTDHDGVFEVPGSGLADGGRHCSGWYDIVNFGHKDALINVWCVGALDALAQLAAFAGDGDASARYATAHRRSAEAYNRVFWDDAHDLYLDWIDVREQMPDSGRRYFYTDQNMAAIIFGIADEAKARRILAHLDRRYDALCQEFRLSRDAIYATPANMYPVSRLGDLVDFGKHDSQAVYPHYENGCSFFHSTGLEIAARGIAGQADAAYDAFERVMRCGYAHNRLWGAALKWDTGAIVSEPLNNALLILWGFLRGCFGIRPTLTGLRLDGAVAAKLEGATHTFCHLGRDVSVRVQDGKCVRNE